jgi:hypothetical protein
MGVSVPEMDATNPAAKACRNRRAKIGKAANARRFACDYEFSD